MPHVQDFQIGRKAMADNDMSPKAATTWKKKQTKATTFSDEETELFISEWIKFVFI